MYQTSAAYKDAVGRNARAHKITGTVNGVAFNGGDILRGSFSVRNQLCEATKISLGGVYVGQMELTFTKAFADAQGLRGAWKGKQITVQLGVEIFDQPEPFEFVPAPGGTYTIEEATWVDVGLKITAYDNMSLFDRTLPVTQLSGRPYDILIYSCQQCGVVLEASREEIEALPNGGEDLGLYPGSTVQTFRDLIAQLATALCCFATINRSGQLGLRRLPNYQDIAAEVPARLRYSTSFSDYMSYYSDIKVENMKTNGTAAEHYTNSNVGGLSMDIGANPLLQYGTQEAVDRMRQNIIDGLEDFRTVPFKASLLADPSYDLGDLVQFDGGIGQDSLGCVMAFTMKVDSITLEGFGENPAAAGVQSAVQKEIDAQGNRGKENELVVHTYTNTPEYQLEDAEEQTVIEIEFATINPTIVTMLHEINLDLDVAGSSATVTAYYYLNNVLETYQPVGTFSEDGKHIITLMYFLNTLAEGTVYEWTVKLRVDGGTATIARGDIHAWLQGQGLVASNDFNGRIRLKDTYTPIVGGQDIISLSELISISTGTPETITANDIITAYKGGQDIISLVDNMSLTRTKEQFYIVTEEGDNLSTEDGDLFIT